MSKDSNTETYQDLDKYYQRSISDEAKALLSLGNSIERAANNIATSIDSLELVIRTKKPEGL